MFPLRTLARFRNLDSVRLLADSVRHVPKANSSSFVQNIFAGEAKVAGFFPYPKVLSEDELSIIDMVSAPAIKMYDTEYDALKVEENTVLEPKHLQLLKDIGTFGIQVPAEYGGMSFNNTQYARLVESLWGFDLGITIFIGSHQSIGYKGLVLYGTPEQKEQYLPSLAAGEKIACFALTEPSAGSDAKSIKSRAVLSEDGKHWILNASKTFISNGGIADYFTVFAQTPVKTESGEVKDKMTAFWVKRGPGVTSGPPMHKMGIIASNTAEVYFDNVKVPVENVIGPVGEGFKVAMNILNNGRYGMCCGLSGTMKKAIEIASAHANNRVQFGNKLASYTGIQEKIARMTMRHYTTQSLAYMLSGLMDNKMKDFQLEAAISKVYASESAWYVVDETLQILGGMGYMRETGVEKMLRDVRIFRIFEGANEVLRQFISLTGIQYAGGHLKEIQKAMKNPMANLGMIFEEGTRRIKRSVGLDTPNFTEHVHPDLHAEAQQLAKSIVAFGSSVEHLLVKYNRNIVQEQMLLHRLANAAIDIYASLAVLSRATRGLNQNVISADIERNMAKVICSEASLNVERNLKFLKYGEALKNDETMRVIAREVLQNGSIIHSHPLD